MTTLPHYSSLISATLDVEAFRRALGLHGPGDGLEQLREAWPVSPDRLQWAYRVAGIRLADSQAMEAVVLFGQQLATVADRADASIETIHQVEVLVDAAFTVHETEFGLSVDGDLGGRLPLLDLARDVAYLQPGGRLVVRADQLTGCRGLYSRSSRSAVIVLDRSLEGQDLADVFAHELAHAVDPQPGEIDAPGMEAFAYELGPVIASRLPVSLAELSPLINDALDATRSARRPRSACSNVDGLIRWVAVEVGALSESPEFIAADRTWHPSRGRDVKSPPAVQEAPTDCDKDGQQGRLIPSTPAVPASRPRHSTSRRQPRGPTATDTPPRELTNEDIPAELRDLNPYAPAPKHATALEDLGRRLREKMGD